MKYTTFLLLDDNDTANFYNKDVMSEFDSAATIHTFDHPDLFINYFKQHTDKASEMLLLLDINMPQKTGFDVMEELEESAPEFEFLNTILVTSSNFKVDHEKATRFSSVIGFIEKPLTLEKLNKVLSEHEAKK